VEEIKSGSLKHLEGQEDGLFSPFTSGTAEVLARRLFRKLPKWESCQVPSHRSPDRVET